MFLITSNMVLCEQSLLPFVLIQIVVEKLFFPFLYSNVHNNSCEYTASHLPFCYHITNFISFIPHINYQSIIGEFASLSLLCSLGIRRGSVTVQRVINTSELIHLNIY